ncbi:plant cysteine oxidase 2-like [Ananas comosus]|uniref:cysteine dioxygenase n=2 Tax=Ananas comosus TaxID=4615 RepID=A0A6P5FPJ7_ANACO|nr:plant cysteine oxidase 2-like [Ananas comosus]CAD1843102.1 unnamed protein product [Ananas comosus var. bracteatus]
MRVVESGVTPELASGTSSKTASRKSRRRQKKPGPMTPPVQRLFDTCQEVFAHGGAASGAGAGAVPPPEDVARLKSILDDMTGADVGLTRNMPYFRNISSQRAPPITYLHVYECDHFSIGIFCLPPSGVIPLHNHPGMTVFSKLLFGSMHIKSYDWADVPQNPIVQHREARLAKLKTNAVFTAPCETSILYPADGGNMHCFTAMTSCAVLDVLGPPYSDNEGRHCTYYNDFSYASFPGDAALVTGEGEGYAWLEERERPDDVLVVGAKYRGPRIVEH